MVPRLEAGFRTRLNRALFDAEQKAHWSRADPAHERWRTLEVIRRLEEAVYASVPGIEAADRVLDVGCAEGDASRILQVLGFHGTYVGIDFSPEKLSYAQSTFPEAVLVAGSAPRLPFRDLSFPIVICRDLLHHVQDRAGVVSELLRVAQGCVVIIEPNPFAPLIAGLGLLRRFERGLFGSSPGRLQRLLRREGWTTRVLAAEPHSFARLLCHHRFGIPSLASSRLAAAAFKALDRAAALLPKGFWSYQVCVLSRNGWR